MLFKLSKIPNAIKLNAFGYITNIFKNIHVSIILLDQINILLYLKLVNIKILS